MSYVPKELIWTYNSVWRIDRVHQTPAFKILSRETHPAQYHWVLPYILIQRYTIVGDWVLDPMAGSGTTCLVAKTLNRNCIYNDVVEKYMKEAKKRIEGLGSLERRLHGKVVYNLGDARLIDKTLQQLHQEGKIPFPKADFIMFSPPYWIQVKYEKANKGIQIGDISNYNTYKAMMLAVYRACRRALKPKKYMAVVIADVRREGKLWPVGIDAVDLIQKAGFTLHDIIIEDQCYANSLARYRGQQLPLAKKEKRTVRCHQYIIVGRNE